VNVRKNTPPRPPAEDFYAASFLAWQKAHGEQRVFEAIKGGLGAHYQSEPKAAAQLLTVGDSKPNAKLDKPTLAAYTLLANELMNLDEVLNK
jgi:hypothetical protein